MGADMHSVAQIKVDDKWETIEFRVNGDHRNYNLFAMLADVRNGVGFAGVDTGDGYKPICAPKGFPEGFGVDHEGSHRGCWMGDHSFTWLSLKELLAYDLYQTTKIRGLIELSTYNEWKSSGDRLPAKWCSDISGPGIIKITEAEVKTMKFNDDARVYVRFELEERYRDNGAMVALVERLEEIAANAGLEDKPDCVRIVMGFDS